MPADTTTAGTNPNADIRDIASVMKYLLSRCQELKLVGPFNMTICAPGGRTFTFRVTERENADPEIVLLHAFTPVPFRPPMSILIVDNEGSTRLLSSGVSHAYWLPRGSSKMRQKFKAQKWSRRLR